MRTKIKERILEVLKSNNSNPDEGRYGSETIILFQSDGYNDVEETVRDCTVVFEDALDTLAIKVEAIMTDVPVDCRDKVTALIQTFLKDE